MSKYKIENGIWKTPVFHGNSYFFIERQEFKQVREVKDNSHVYYLGLWMIHGRPNFDLSSKEIKGHIDYSNDRGQKSAYHESLKNELILRN